MSLVRDRRWALPSDEQRQSLTLTSCFHIPVLPLDRRFELSGRLVVGVSMCTGEKLSWWDRDLDHAGNPIRADVRSAARELWNHACQQTRTLLGDPSEAPGLMEASIIQVSHYLDRRAVALFEHDASALLACAFYRRLRRHLGRLRRLELAADVSHLAVPRVGRSCVSKQDCHLDAEKLVHQLSDRARQMYELRNAGYGWKEIADTFEMSDAAARAEFSRELKRLRRELLRGKRLPTQDPPDAGQQH